MPSMYSSASLVAGLVLYTAVSAAPQQAYTITNSAGEVVTLLPTTTVGLDTGLVTVPVGTPILGPSSNDEGTMIVTLPVEPTDANGSTVFPPVSIPPVSMPTIIDPPIVSGGPTLSLSVPPVPMPTIVTTGSSSSPSSSGSGGGGGSSSTTQPAGSSNSASLPPPTSTVAPAAAPRATGFVGAAVGVVAAVAGVLYL